MTGLRMHDPPFQFVMQCNLMSLEHWLIKLVTLSKGRTLGVVNKPRCVGSAGLGRGTAWRRSGAGAHTHKLHPR